jgi:nucleoside phosphorylase
MPLVDYLVLTALDQEWMAASEVFHGQRIRPREHAVKAATYYLWSQPVKGSFGAGQYLVVGAPMSLWTPGQSKAATFTANGAEVWRPARVVMMGIAGSIDPGTAALGDVIVADEIHGIEIRDVTDSGARYRTTSDRPSALDLDRVRAFRRNPADYARWQQACAAGARRLGIAIKRPPALHLTAIASGNDVVRSAAAGQLLKRDVSFWITAVEMESRGVHQALDLDSRGVQALMIRGISDYADAAKEELESSSKGAWREYAAANAARLLRALWRRAPVKPISPGYHLNVTLGEHVRFSTRRGIPPLPFRVAGAQDLPFPSLLDRSAATPPLAFRVRATDAAGHPIAGARAVRIATTPSGRSAASLVPRDGALHFVTPHAAAGIRVELLLSLPTAAAEVTIECRDEFGRSAVGVWR